MLEGLLSFILFFVVGFWLLGMIGRVLLRLWIRKKQRQFAEQFGEGAPGGGFFYRQYGFGQGGRRSSSGGFGAYGPKTEAPADSTTQKEGEVTLSVTPELREKQINGTIGDYVDFEEVK